MDYRGKRNMRQIGNALRVSHVLEGSARRDGNRIRLRAQLIDTRTDTHVWAERYESHVSDLFAIQSEIAQKVADRLNAKITAAERLAIEDEPTTDLDALDLYARARKIVWHETHPSRTWFTAVDLLNQAVARDPSFFKAYEMLAVFNGQLYQYGFDHTPARLAMAEAAIQEASRLRPDAGETHHLRAGQLYSMRDYDGALAELKIAEPKLPNDSSVFSLKASIQRRQGRWEESTRNFERAVELDPRNIRRLKGLGDNYAAFRRYAEQKSMLDRALAIEPNNLALKADRALVEFDWKADARPLCEYGEPVLCALVERDAAAAKDTLSGWSAEETLYHGPVHLTRPFLEGVIARMTNDEHKARLAFTAARGEQEKIVQAQPDFGPALCVLGLIDAGLGRKEEALREGRRAVELLPVEKDVIDGPLMIKYLTMIAAWVGEKDLACEQLAIVIRYPFSGHGLSYGELKLLPEWDPMRGEPCFEKIVASLAPKETVSK
jgi:tetratricopeptide (TPR) repeat protein